MSDQELQILFEGTGAEELADRLMDFVESELEGEATGGVYSPDSGDWTAAEAPAPLTEPEEDEDLGEAGDDLADDDGGSEDDADSTADDPLDDPDDWESSTASSSEDEEAEDRGFLVTVSRTCFEVSDELDADDVEARAEALLEWLDEETKHMPEVHVEIWFGSDAAGAQSLDELDAELLLELLEATGGR